jgi:flagellar basal-body rod protein FlgC
MNKTIFFTLLSMFPYSTVSASSTYREKIVSQIEVVSANIANANTTRTPEGGPYKKKSIYCSNSECTYDEELDVILTYNPTHIDADVNGYVASPNIDVADEMDRMIELQELYEQNLSN